MQERREINPQIKGVYLETLKEAAERFYQFHDSYKRGSMGWFEVLENFNKTEDLARFFNVSQEDVIGKIIEAIPHGLRKGYFATISPGLSNEVAAEIRSKFGFHEE